MTDITTSSSSSNQRVDAYMRLYEMQRTAEVPPPPAPTPPPVHQYFLFGLYPLATLETPNKWCAPLMFGLIVAGIIMIILAI